MADRYQKLTNFGTDLLKKVVPPQLYQRLRQVILFRAEDPNNLHQVLPQMKVANNGVERIKGFRFPSPGSQGEVRIPLRESADDVYDITHYARDSRNLKIDTIISLTTSKGDVDMNLADPHLPSHGKRKITLLPYDPSGLRTTKTTTWEATDKVLLAKAMPNHLPFPEWIAEVDDINAKREAKGLPPPLGRRMKYNYSKNYNEVRW